MNVSEFKILLNLVAQDWKTEHNITRRLPETEKKIVFESIINQVYEDYLNPGSTSIQKILPRTTSVREFIDRIIVQYDLLHIREQRLLKIDPQKDRLIQTGITESSHNRLKNTLIQIYGVLTYNRDTGKPNLPKGSVNEEGLKHYLSFGDNRCNRVGIKLHTRLTKQQNYECISIYTPDTYNHAKANDVLAPVYVVVDPVKASYILHLPPSMFSDKYKDVFFPQPLNFGGGGIVLDCNDDTFTELLYRGAVIDDLSSDCSPELLTRCIVKRKGKFTQFMGSKRQSISWPKCPGYQKGIEYITNPEFSAYTRQYDMDNTSQLVDQGFIL
jgi:hypothetical protein